MADQLYFAPLKQSLCKLFMFFAFLFSTNLKAQDTTASLFMSEVKKMGDNEAKRSVLKFKEARAILKQEELMQGIKETMQKAKIYMKSGLDTTLINAELVKVQKWYEIAGDGIFVNKGSSQTYRNLTTTSKILSELLSRILKHKKDIDKHEKDLVNFRYKIDSLSGNPILYNFPSDSVTVTEYAQKIMVVVKSIAPADSALKQAISNIRKVQIQVDLIVNKLAGSLEEIEGYQRRLSSKIFDREFANLNGSVSYARPFSEILSFSKEKGGLILLFYVQNNFGKLILVVISLIGSSIFIITLKKMLMAQKLLNDDFSGQLIFRYPLLSALVIVLNLFQFIFTEPPFVFSCLFWILSAIALTFIFRGFITRYWMSIWLAMLILFIFSCAGNLILQASRPERWYMIILASIGVVVGLISFIKGSKQELKEKLIIYFIALVVVLELASIIANCSGRYNLSKSLLISGYLNVIVGILLLWTVRLTNEGLAFASRVYTRQEKKLFYINFNSVGEKVPPIFYLFLVLGWFILFGRNFYIFKLLTDPLKDSFFSERLIGNYSFTISNLVVFFLILFLSVLVSKIVSFFASDKHPVSSSIKERKAGVGSWLLLIRVFIIGCGTLLALAASGFPMEKITIVIGALGVGIGFGLQTLVNNLVSGLIIAFEKPVNVGDMVEIAGHTGTMKSIGFRSSIIAKSEGADVVIPNGDLLNAHLVNWTLAGGKKQINLTIGVAYGTNLSEVKQLLNDIMIAEDRILKSPAPAVFFQDFNSSSIDVQLIFWVHDPKDGFAVKSEVISEIDSVFRANGIVIPFPQQDIHIQTPKPAKRSSKIAKDDT